MELGHITLIQRSNTYNFMSQGLSAICKHEGVSTWSEKHKQRGKSETYGVQNMREDDGGHREDDFWESQLMTFM